MKVAEFQEKLEIFPVIPAVRGEELLSALHSEAEVVFLLDADVMTVGEKIDLAHENEKSIFIHVDLMNGIGKDRQGIRYLAELGADGIISTRAPLIKCAKEIGLVAIQRYFAVDSHGLESIREMIASAKPDFVEIMPGIIEKVIRRFADEKTPVIASGLLETKGEVTAALASGAFAVSTGKSALWSI